MTVVRKVAVLVGSLRKESINLKLAQALARLAPESLELEIIDISGLSFYNEDIEPQPPQTWQDFRARIRSADAVMLVSPEYNRSIPAVLKNAIDIGSRPYGQSVWNGKPTAVITASPGPIGGFGANHHLRQTLVALNMPVLQTPEAYIGRANDLFDEQGHVKDETTRDFLRSVMQSFAEWVHLIKGQQS